MITKLSLFLASLLLLAACSTASPAPEATEESAEPEATESAEQKPSELAEPKEMTEEGFITQVRGDGFLVNNIFFSVNEEVTVTKNDGTAETEAVLRDIEIGMKVAVDYVGAPTGQLPMEADADTVTILTDTEAARQSAALHAFIYEEKLASLAILGQPIVRGNEIGFLFTNMESGDLSEVRIDLDTHEYTIGGE